MNSQPKNDESEAAAQLHSVTTKRTLHLSQNLGVLALLLSSRLSLLGSQLLLQVCRATRPQRPVSRQLGLSGPGCAACPAQLLLAPLLPLLQGRWCTMLQG